MHIRDTILLLCGLLVVTPAAFGQSTSTTAGGNWWETTTWIGGSIPTAGDDVIVQGPVIIRSGDTCRNLTVASNGGITDLLGGNHLDELLVEGDADVAGTVLPADSPNNLLALRIRGNIVVSGRWAPDATYLDGSDTQTIATTGSAVVEGVWVDDNPTRSLALGGSLALGAADLNLMGGALEGSGQTITADSTSRIRNGALTGTFTLAGRHSVPTGLTYSGTVTNMGILEADPLGAAVDQLRITGSILNQGIVRDEPGSFVIIIDGSVANEGGWHTRDTRFVGKANHLVSNGQPLRGGWSASDTATVIADGDLIFEAAHIGMNQGRFEMGSHALYLTDGSTLVDVRLDAGEIHQSGNSSLQATVSSDVNLYGAAEVFDGTEFLRNVVVHDTLRDAPGGFAVESVRMRGTLVNYGVIEGALNVHAEGDLINHGHWSNLTTLLEGSGRRTIVGGLGIDSQIRANGPDVILTDDIHLNQLWVNPQASATVAGTASLYLPGGGLIGDAQNFNNLGRVVMHRTAAAGARLTFHEVEAQMPAQLDFDTLLVSTYGSQVPPTFASAVATWWRFEPDDPTSATLQRITLAYDEARLGTNDESELQIYRSGDDGATWSRISTPTNLTIDEAANTATILNVPATGDYLLSSDAESASVVPNVVTSITGRPNIRIGAPSRYLVQWVNASDVPTEQMMMLVSVDQGAHILSIEMIGEDGLVEETLAPEDFAAAGADSDTLAFLLLEGLAAHEERSMNVIATADPESGKQAGVIAMTVTIVFGTGAVVVGGALAWDFLGKFCNNIAGELRANNISREAFERAWSDSWTQMKEQFSKTTFLTAMEELVKSLCHAATGASFCASEGNRLSMSLSLYECIKEGVSTLAYWAKNFKPIQCAIEKLGGGNRKWVGFTGVEDCTAPQNDDLVFTLACPAVSSTAVLLPTVRSWDPNEKVGPTGAGMERFISRVGRMHYTILFENKAEATAPAYRITVHDTLATEFDQETVEFGTTSHQGFTITRSANVLTWDIEGIELPPNVNPPEGEGFVTFSVLPRSDVPSGTALENRATIVFDVNPPITTNTVANVLDFVAPVTTMTALPGRIDANSVTVRWETTDEQGGSGIENSSVFGARNGRGYTMLGVSATDSLVVPLDSAGSYSFYALSVDRAGNAEADLPQAVTTQVFLVGTEGSDLPFTFHLDQNYPNPFNPTTTITYSVPRRDRTTVEVYDAIGRRVVRLVDAVLAPGEYRATWNARAAASGVYFYRLTQAKRRSVRPMVLIR